MATACGVVQNAVAVTPKYRPLSLEVLQQMEYTLDIPSQERTITETPLTWPEFINGDGSQPTSNNLGKVVLIEGADEVFDVPIVYRDLNGDNLEDALVPLWVLPTSYAREDGRMALATVINQGGQPVHVATEWFGLIYGVEPDGDQVTVYAGMTIPDLEEEVFSYRWDEAGLALVGRGPVEMVAPFPSGHERYQALDMARFSDVIPTNKPMALAQDLFGYRPEPNQGMLARQAVEILEETEDSLTVGFAKWRLQDDSVWGLRYRLEFVREDSRAEQTWRLRWIGSQVSCSRGRQSWHRGTCI